MAKKPKTLSKGTRVRNAKRDIDAGVEWLKRCREAWKGVRAPTRYQQAVMTVMERESVPVQDAWFLGIGGTRRTPGTKTFESLRRHGWCDDEGMITEDGRTVLAGSWRPHMLSVDTDRWIIVDEPLHAVVSAVNATADGAPPGWMMGWSHDVDEAVLDLMAIGRRVRQDRNDLVVLQDGDDRLDAMMAKRAFAAVRIELLVELVLALESAGIVKSGHVVYEGAYREHMIL
jgi:hypothetical protein